MNDIRTFQSDLPDTGRLKVSLTSSINGFPIADASISISYTGVPDSQLEQLTTNSSGQTDTIDLPAPPLEYSLDVTNEIQPYSEYTIQAEAPGYEPISIAGAVLKTILFQSVYKLLYCFQCLIRKFIISFLLSSKSFNCIYTVLHSSF